MDRKYVKSIAILCYLLSALLLVPGNAFSAKPLGPELRTDVFGEGSIDPSGDIYKKNNMVPIEAIPVSGWVFDHWEGDLTGAENPTIIRMTSDKYVVAVFLKEGPVEYTLTTEVIGNGSVSVTPDGGTYFEDTVISMEAFPEPDSEWEFDHWEGDLSGTSKTATITMDADKHVIAVFSDGVIPPPPSDKEIIGYFIQWGVYRRDYHVKNIVTSGSADKLTVINYAFAGIGDDLKCEILDPYADYNKRFDADESVDGVEDTVAQPLKGNFNQLKKLKAMCPNIRVMISIGGWSDSDKFSDAALEENRSSFVSSCIDMFINGNFDPADGVVETGVFDGIDIDWEYPGACGATCDFREEDTKNYTALLAEFRSQLDAVDDGLLLSVASPASQEYYDKIELELIHPHLDWINLMTYDFHGSWEPDGPTNHHANLYSSDDDPFDPPLSADATVQGYIVAGVPPHKINLGLPFYGRGWASVPDANNGLYQRAGRIPRGTWEKGSEDYKVLKDKGYPGFWEDKAKAHWIYNGNTFWTYDNEMSIGWKMQYINNHELGGVMFWELSGDDAEGTLIHAIEIGLH